VLKITTTRENDQRVRVQLCGQFTREYVAELEQAIFVGESPAENVALDLANVTFVDREAMGFLCSARTRKVAIENIPSYVIRWIEQERVCGASHPETESPEKL
jgi:ABC-type transporter Mla MlaB component